MAYYPTEREERDWIEQDRREASAKERADLLAALDAAEARASALSARLADLQQRCDMAARRLSAPTGHAELDLGRLGAREAWFAVVRELKEALASSPPASPPAQEKTA